MDKDAGCQFNSGRMVQVYDKFQRCMNYRLRHQWFFVRFYLWIRT